MMNNNEPEQPSMVNNTHEDNLFSVPIEIEQQQMNLQDEDVSVNDPFLNLLCFDNNDEDEVELSSVDDSSESEKDYDKDVEDDEDYEDEAHSNNEIESPAQLKDMLIDYGVANGYQLVFTVNDNNRLLVRCGAEETNIDGMGKKIKMWKCTFRLWASRVTDDDSFQIKTLNDQHTCVRQFCLGSLVTYTWIAKRFFNQIIRNPEITLRQMQQDMIRKYQCRVSIGQCMRAKEKVLYDFEANSTTKQFFEDKMEELKSINKSAYDHLMERNPSTWSKAFF
ncbi:hypothetical protein E3N88_04936 [Mikania micrantha]|uniref:Transposase MuDR plant domain-containing protein n=1 Tax=Mikania micrantha TaxID=192012 RepID=A0A5N6PXZ7_9ASTR|nr:hypothetical protein E3N88_04936 [Mikania micrantha]